MCLVVSGYTLVTTNNIVQVPQQPHLPFRDREHPPVPPLSVRLLGLWPARPEGAGVGHSRGGHQGRGTGMENNLKFITVARTKIGHLKNGYWTQ